MSMLTICTCEVCLPFRIVRPGTLLDSTAEICLTLCLRPRHLHHPSTTTLHITSHHSPPGADHIWWQRTESYPNNIDIATSINSSY